MSRGLGDVYKRQVVPSVLKQNTEIVINLELNKSLQRPNADLRNLKHLVDEVKKWNIPVDNRILSYQTANKINRLISGFSKDPDDIKILTDISGILNMTKEIDLDPSLNELQNKLLQISRESLDLWSQSKLPSIQQLLTTFLKLASEVQLDIFVPEAIKKS